jgi:hypothetical protein
MLSMTSSRLLLHNSPPHSSQRRISTNNALWARDAPTFLQEPGPPLRWHKGMQQTGVDQIEGVIGKVKRFECVHQPEMGIG